MEAERCFQSIPRLRNYLDVRSLVSPSSLLLLMPSIFIIMKNIGKGKEFMHMFLATSEFLFSIS